jgi:hypothetical protein
LCYRHFHNNFSLGNATWFPDLVLPTKYLHSNNQVPNYSTYGSEQQQPPIWHVAVQNYRWALSARLVGETVPFRPTVHRVWRVTLVNTTRRCSRAKFWPWQAPKPFICKQNRPKWAKISQKLTQASVHGGPWPVTKHLKCSIQSHLWPVTEHLVEMVQYEWAMSAHSSPDFYSGSL